jgi:tetratricopeptide (TPR) repeat protein
VQRFFSGNKKIFIPVIIIACLYSAKTFSRSGDWKDNPTLFGHDVKTSSRSATAHYHWGNALNYMLYEKEMDETRKQSLASAAITEYSKAIEIYPGYMDAYKHLGVAYSRVGDNLNALKYFQKHDEFTGGSDFEVLQMKANLYDKTKQYDKAIEAFSLVLQRKPEAKTYYYIGLLYNKKNQYETAIKYLDSALALQPDNLFTRKNKALALANLKRNAEALAQCDTMLQLNPKYAKAFCYKGFAYTDMKDYPKAIENFEKAVELDPKDSESIGHLIVLYRFTGNNAKADALQQQTGDK